MRAGRSTALVVNEVDGARFRVEALPPGRVAVLFCADWCGFCRRFTPHYKRIREGYVVDISDEDLPVWDELRIHVVPTVILFDGHVEVKRWAGVLADHHVAQVEDALRAP